MYNVVTGRAFSGRDGVRVVQNMTGMTEYAFRSQAIIVLPILAQVLMPRMTQQSYLWSRKASRRIQNPRLWTYH